LSFRPFLLRGLFFLSLLWAGSTGIQAQDLAPSLGGLDGRVREQGGRPVRGATVLVLPLGGETPVASSSTDETGYFRIPQLPAGEIRLRVLRIGFEPWESVIEVAPGRGGAVDIELRTAAVALAGISVEGERSRARARFEGDAGITIRELSREQIRLLPGLAEADPVRAIEVLAGVISPNDFSGSFNVRGGSADQNLVLLDGFPLFSPFHLGGIFSVFSADMIDRVELQSGGFPAEFGGRVSSVLRVETDPGPGSLQVDGGVSLLATRMAVSGGLPEGLRSGLGLASARWRVSGRRSYVDQLSRPFFEIPYYIGDYQGIFEAWTPGGSRWTFTAYSGEDVLDLARLPVEDFPLRAYWDWGNTLTGLRWLRAFPGGGTLEAAAGRTKFATELRFADFDDSRFQSQIEQVHLRASGKIEAGRGWTLQAGVAGDRYGWENLAEAGGARFSGRDGLGWSPAAFGQVLWSAPGRWIVEGGWRWEGWISEDGVRSDVPSPRFSAKRFLGESSSSALKLSLGRYVQFLHSVRDEELPLGLDLWVTTGEDIPQVVSDQVQVGWEQFLGSEWMVGVETFVRTFDGVITPNQASDPNRPEDEYLSGRGDSHGVDVFLERDAEGWAGTLSVSWLRATRTFPDFLSGKTERPEITYPPIFDRRLDVDLNLRIPLPRGWRGGLRWHAGTGLPYTQPVAAYPFLGPRQTQGGRLGWQGTEGGEEGPRAVLLGPRNGARTPLYHRLDVSVRKSYSKRWGEISPYFDLLNVYNQPNVLFFFYDLESTPATRSGLTMFPLLPTLGFDVRFR